MGPIRGNRKKRKIDNTTKEYASGSGSTQNEGPVDWWDEFSKRINGLQFPSNGLEGFEHVFKISRRTFDYICSLVKEDMVAKSREFKFLNGECLSLHDQVAVALRRLGSGDSLVTVAQTFGLNHSTVSQVTWRFVQAMEERALHHLQWPTEPEMAEIKTKFEKIQGLPNCCGVIDTTHIMMFLSSSEHANNNVWLDHEKKHSMVLQAVVDPDMRFRDILTGWPGKLEDWVVFQNSKFYERCDRGERLNGEKLRLSEGEIREYVIGDAGYPLLPYLLVPYVGKELPELRAEFNERHSATQMVGRRALARLKETWRIINGQMWRPDKHRLPRIILVCCLLHNIAIDLQDEVQGHVSSSHEHDPGYQQQICGSVDMKGVHLRDKLSLYLSGMPPR